MNGLIENRVQKKKKVFPPVMAGSSPKWFTQREPLICSGLKQKPASGRQNYRLLSCLASLRPIDIFNCD